MKKAPEAFRLTRQRNEILGTDASYGNNGVFVIPHHRIDKYFYNCNISDGSFAKGLVGLWEHVSVTIDSTTRKVERCPTWEEMCYVKSIFWDDEESVMQLHPPKSQWVSMHPWCLHLWKPLEAIIPLPDPIMVGVPGSNVQSL